MIFQFNRLDDPNGVGTQHHHKGHDPGKMLCQRNGGPGDMIVHLSRGTGFNFVCPGNCNLVVNMLELNPL